MTDVDKEPTLNELNPTFGVGTQTYESKLMEDLFINRGDLQGEFVRHPERYGFYATCFEIANAKVELHSVALKRLYAMIDYEKRSTATLNSTGRVTEKMIENMVITDERYIELQEQTLEAQKQQGLLKAAMTSMQHRKDMLIQLGSAFRAEMQADMSVRTAAARDTMTSITR